MLEPQERRAVSVMAQLNAIRNAKAQAKREHNAKRQAARAKKFEAENEWRKDWNKEQRKRRYVEQGRLERANAKRKKQE